MLLNITSLWNIRPVTKADRLKKIILNRYWNLVKSLVIWIPSRRNARKGRRKPDNMEDNVWERFQRSWRNRQVCVILNTFTLNSITMFFKSFAIKNLPFSAGVDLRLWKNVFRNVQTSTWLWSISTDDRHGKRMWRRNSTRFTCCSTKISCSCTTSMKRPATCSLWWNC